MEYYPDIPSAPNKVQDDLHKIRANFQHLGPLAGSVTDLEVVSGLAPHVDDLESVSTLAPHVGEILDSRIVDHNLDVLDPPNGYYVRWENGLQVCFGTFKAEYANQFRLTSVWTFPAAFASRDRVKAWLSIDSDTNIEGLPGGSQSVGAISVRVATTSQANVRMYRAGDVPLTEDSYMTFSVLAIGPWK